MARSPHKARSRHKLTDAEREQRRRRDRERLADAIRELLSSEGWRAWLRTRATLHGCSWDFSSAEITNSPGCSRRPSKRRA
jgi:hypothetical protein